MKKDRRKRRPEKDSEHYGGIRLQMMNNILIVLVVLVSVVLLVGIDLMTENYQNLKKTTDIYVTCQDDARDVMEASDYLTSQARSFVVTGDESCLDNYFRESKQIKRRETALNEVRNNMPQTKALEFLNAAYDESITLMDTEYYAMNLSAVARDYDLSACPSEIRNVHLSAADRALSPEDQIARATKLLFDKDYQAQKNSIYANVQDCLQQMMFNVKISERSDFQTMEESMHRVSVMIGSMMFFFLLLVILIIVLIVRPLERNVGYINKKAHLPMKGAFEMQYMAAAYNRMLDENREQSDRLAYDAIHDALTGAFNRAGFEDRYQEVDRQTSTLVLLDIDYFKEINDTYGHTVGDLILKQVVRLIQENFRQEDFICRVGGDEFAVIMLYMDSSLRSVVKDKFDAINHRLSHPDGTLPPVTLSAGVAFCDRKGATDNMFRDADDALYEVKRKGRNGIQFFGE